MEKEMSRLKVYTTERGEICISAEYNMGEEDFVTFHPEQAEIVIKWIRESVEELQNQDTIQNSEIEISSILSGLNFREKTELMTLIYKFVDEHKK